MLLKNQIIPYFRDESREYIFALKFIFRKYN